MISPRLALLLRQCCRCGHSWSLHGKGMTACRAMGCRAGENGPCPDFGEAPADGDPRSPVLGSGSMIS